MPLLRSNRRREPVSTRKRRVAFEHKGNAGRLRSYLDSIWRNILLPDVRSGSSIRSSLTHFAFSTLIWLLWARDHGESANAGYNFYHCGHRYGGGPLLLRPLLPIYEALKRLLDLHLGRLAHIVLFR
jgi:hypothetical protein